MSKTSLKLQATDTTAAFRPGYVIVSTSTARGGVQYNRKEVSHVRHDDGSEESRHVTDKNVDNINIIKQSEALVKKADYALKKHATNTAFGWWCDAANLSGIEEEYVALRVEEAKINRLAQQVGSARRVHVGFVAAKLVLDELSAREIATTIVLALQRFSQALRAGEVRDFKDNNGKIIIRDQVRAAEIIHGNLDKLAVGMAHDVLKLAIDSIRPVKKSVNDAIDNGLPAETAGATADLSLIENAIHFFSHELI